MTRPASETGTIPLFDRGGEYLTNKYSRARVRNRATLTDRWKQKGERLARYVERGDFRSHRSGERGHQVMPPLTRENAESNPGYVAPFGMWNIPDTYQTWQRRGASERGGKPIDMIFIHTAEGSSGTSNADGREDTSTGCHYSVTFDGRVFSMVDEELASICSHWPANDRSIGIEHSGFAHMPGPPGKEQDGMWGPSEYIFSAPDANGERQRIYGWGGLSPQLHASAKLIADISRRYNIPIDRNHIVGHSENPGNQGTRTDPGPHWPWEKYYEWARFYRSQMTNEGRLASYAGVGKALRNPFGIVAGGVITALALPRLIQRIRRRS